MLAPQAILITGASSGIGRALAIAYAAPEIRLALIGRHDGRLAATAEACRAAGATVGVLRADVRDRVTLQSWIERQDDSWAFDLAIPAAGITAGLSVAGRRESEAARRAVFATNLDGAIHTVEPLIDRMCSRRRGQLGFIGSLAAYRGLPYCPSYCASKAAIHVYAEALRASLRPHFVTVSLVVPGFVATAMNEALVAPPFARLTDTDAAGRIRHGLAAGHAVIGFPRLMYLGGRMLGWLPRHWTDGVLRRVQVVVPEPNTGSELSDPVVFENLGEMPSDLPSGPV